MVLVIFTFVISVSSEVDACHNKNSVSSPNSRFNLGIPKSQPNEVSSPKADENNQTLGAMDIGFIILGSVAAVVIVIGLYFVYRYCRIIRKQEKVKAKQKHKDVQTYLDALPDYSTNAQMQTTPHSLQSSISRSTTSKDPIISGPGADNSKLGDCQVWQQSQNQCECIYFSIWLYVCIYDNSILMFPTTPGDIHVQIFSHYCFCW